MQENPQKPQQKNAKLTFFFVFSKKSFKMFGNSQK